MVLRNLVLDLDNTLIFGFRQDQPNFLDIDLSKGVKVGDYLFFIRPYCYEFLDYIFRKYNVGIFTAATKLYADDVIDTFFLKYKKHLHFVFIKEEYDKCKFATGGVKDINFICSEVPHFLPTETMIIDDCYGVKYTNMDRAIQVTHWIPAREDKDDQLLRLMKEI